MKIFSLILSVSVFPVLLFSASVDDGYAAYTAGDFNRSFELLRPFAGAGNPGASFLVGRICLERKGPECDATEGVRLLKVAAGAGHTGAVRMLMDYFDEAGMPEEALYWYERLPASGREGRRMQAARLYRETGRTARAFSMYKRLSKRYRVPEPTYEMGLMYEKGEGCRADTDAAIALYRAAAKRQYAPAQYRLGLLLAKRCRQEEAKQYLERVQSRFDDVPALLDAMVRDCAEAEPSE